MRNTLRIPLMLSLLLFARPGDAAPAAMGLRSLLVSDTFETTVYFGVGWHHITTSGCSLGADPVVHVMPPGGTQREVAHDDDSGGGVNADLWAYITSKGYFVVLMRADRATTTGACDVRVDELLYKQVAVGGTTVIVNQGPGYAYQTAHALGGITDTKLALLDCSGAITVRNDDDGVGLMSRASSSDACEALVTARGTAGRIHFYTNDVGSDADGDGLGALLEGFLGTCEGTCTGVFNAKDSDRDGLSDRDEVFGIDDANAPLLLSAWGANPRHKDAFIELDYSNQFASHPVTATDLRAMQAYFSEGSSYEWQNPDGQPGLQLHFDVGFGSTLPAEVAVGAFGNFGGSNRAATADREVAYGSAFAMSRRGVFRYVLATLGGGGQANGDRIAIGVNGIQASLPHEIGHSMGLTHWGHSNWGAFNCKPNYPSLMNYAFLGGRFSHGSLASLSFNPAAVNENVDFSYAPATFLPGMAAQPWVERILSNRIDWNRDGFISTLPLREPLTLNEMGCAPVRMNEQTLGTTNRIGASSDLVKFGSRMYVFFVRPDGTIAYRSGVVSGPDARGSCPNGDGVGTRCMTFDAERVLPTAQLAASVQVAMFRGRIALAYAPRSQRGPRLLSVTTVNGDGSIGATSAEQSLDTGAFAVGAPFELAAMRVSPAGFASPSGYVLAAVQRASTPAPSDLWAFATVEDYGGVVRSRSVTVPGTRAASTLATGQASVAPGFTNWPITAAGEPAAGSTSCGAFVDAGSVLQLACYDPASDSYTNYSSTVFSSMSYAEGQPAIAVHALRQQSGAPLSDVRSQLYISFVWPFSQDANRTLRPRTWVTRSAPSYAGVWNALNQPGFRADPGDAWTDMGQASSHSLYEDLSLSAMKGLWAWQTQPTTAGTTPSNVHFLPQADGTFNVDMRDGNDFYVMERSACAMLRGVEYCGTTNGFGY